MFNTRSGFWMLISIGVLSPISAGSLLVLGLNSDVTYQNFVRASGFPMSVILPIIAILAVTGEWSQRSGLTTFTLVPSRGRVIGAKAIATLLVGLGAVSVAFAVGALGNVAGSALAGVDTVVGHFVVHGTPDGALQPGWHGLRLRPRCRAAQLRGRDRGLLRRFTGHAGHPRAPGSGALVVRGPAAVDRLALHAGGAPRWRHEHWSRSGRCSARPR